MEIKNPRPVTNAVRRPGKSAVDQRGFPGTGYSIQQKDLAFEYLLVQFLDLPVPAKEDLPVFPGISIQEFEGTLGISH